jgi:serine/threonine protein kinase
LLDAQKLKIIDFNVAKYFGPSPRLDVKSHLLQLSRMITPTGNILYTAPEVLKDGTYKYSTPLFLGKLIGSLNYF